MEKKWRRISALIADGFKGRDISSTDEVAAYQMIRPIVRASSAMVMKGRFLERKQMQRFEMEFEICDGKLSFWPHSSQFTFGGCLR